MTTRYDIENSFGPTISTDELHELGRDGALELFRKRWRQHQRNLLNPQWQHGRQFPGAEFSSMDAYIAEYEKLNLKRCLTHPGFHYLPPSELPADDDMPEWLA